MLLFVEQAFPLNTIYKIDFHARHRLTGIIRPGHEHRTSLSHRRIYILNINKQIYKYIFREWTLRYGLTTVATRVLLLRRLKTWQKLTTLYHRKFDIKSWALILVGLVIMPQAEDTKHSLRDMRWQLSGFTRNIFPAYIWNNKVSLHNSRPDS